MKRPVLYYEVRSSFLMVTDVYASEIIKYYPVMFDKTQLRVNYVSKGKGEVKGRGKLNFKLNLP
jgi:hypothetical protein